MSGVDLDKLSHEQLEALRKTAYENRNIMAFGELSDYLQKTEYREGSLEEELYQTYLAEKMQIADRNVKNKQTLEATIGKITYRFLNYDHANMIVNNHDWGRKYLKSLVANVTGNGEYADSLDYKGLKHKGAIILGVAKKILKTKPKQK